LIDESAGWREGGWSVELERRIAAGGQMLANEKCHEEQGENAKEAKAAEVAELRGMGLGQTELGERGHMWSEGRRVGRPSGQAEASISTPECVWG
jgi:hypothetical protein